MQLRSHGFTKGMRNFREWGGKFFSSLVQTQHCCIKMSRERKCSFPRDYSFPSACVILCIPGLPRWVSFRMTMQLSTKEILNVVTFFYWKHNIPDGYELLVTIWYVYCKYVFPSPHRHISNRSSIFLVEERAIRLLDFTVEIRQFLIDVLCTCDRPLPLQTDEEPCPPRVHNCHRVQAPRAEAESQALIVLGKRLRKQYDMLSVKILFFFQFFRIRFYF